VVAPRRIGILLFEDVEELDAVGPWEVLAHWTGQHPQDGWAVSCLSRDGEPVTAAKGLVLGAHVALGDARGWTCFCIPLARAPAGSCATRRTWTGCATNVRRYR